MFAGLRSFVLALVLLAFTTPLFAQSSLQGIVRDGSGAVTAMSLPAEGPPRLDRRADPDVLTACD